MVAGLLFVPTFPDPPLHSGAYVQWVTARSAVVARIEPVPTALVCTLWRPDGSQAGLLRAEPRRRHAFEFTGLDPETEHRFELRDAAGQLVDAGRVKTAPARDDAPVRFVMVGDSGGLPWWVWLQRNPLGYLVSRYDLLPVRSEPALIGARMAAAAPDFWLHLGDLVYPWGLQSHYSAGFFRPFEQVLRQAPCFAVLGNHDAMTNDGRPMFANLVLPRGDLTGDERLFSFGWGPIRFVGLDLNRLVESEDPALRFLDRVFEAADEPWRIVMAHFPILSASRQGDRADLVEHLLPRLRRHGVDLFLSGHDHTYQRLAPEPEPTPVMVVSGGGGKSLYSLNVHPNVKKAHALYHFCQVDVQGCELRFIASGADGAELDAFRLDLRLRLPAPGSEPTARERRILALAGKH